MTIKKTIKLVATSLLIGLLLFCVYAQYKKAKFDKIYAQRKSELIYHKYDPLYKSGALNHFKDFILANYDTISSVYELGRSRRREIWSELSNFVKDSSDYYAMKEISKMRFYDVYISRDTNTNDIEIEFEKLFLQYKLKPTYHHIAYTTKRTPIYRFNENDYWFFSSIDVNEHDFGHFMDWRPEWLLPYYEAFDFFKWYPNYSLDK